MHNHNMNALASQLHSKVRGQKVNLALALAEYRQTASLFVDVAQRVATSWRRVRRGDIAGAFSPIGGRRDRKASSNWLAFQYGVQPLVGDIVGSLQVLDKALMAWKPVYRASATITSDVTWPTEVQSVEALKDLVMNRFEKKSIRATCYYTVDNSLLKTASSLGLTNPLSLAWELVPYSFVIDWFVNVGDYLESLDTLSGVDRRIVYYTQKTKGHGHAVMKNGMEWSYIYRETSRSVDGAFPPVRPTFTPSLTWKRLVSAVALLRTSRSM